LAPINAAARADALAIERTRRTQRPIAHSN
jgi:hypothetical protein